MPKRIFISRKPAVESQAISSVDGGAGWYPVKLSADDCHVQLTVTGHTWACELKQHIWWLVKPAVLLQAQAFASWKDVIAYRRVKRGAMTDSVRRLLQGMLGRAFAAWHNRVQEHAALQQKAITCLARLAHAHVASAFSAWIDWAAEQKDHRWEAYWLVMCLLHDTHNCNGQLPACQLWDDCSIYLHDVPA